MHENEDIRELATTGRKIEAIRIYRKRYGVSLAEAKEAVDAVAEGQAFAPPPAAGEMPPDVAAEIDALLQEGQTVEAIRRYREQFPWVGLAQAKDAIHARVAGQPYPTTPYKPTPPAGELSTVDEALLAGQDIQAIRLYREQCGMSLRESKEAVDARRAALGIPKKAAPTGCFIATAAYGSINAPDVVLLRRYRDRVLRRSPAGRFATRVYYQVSPPLARFLAAAPWGRAMVRWLLRPIVGFCRSTLDRKAGKSLLSVASNSSTIVSRIRHYP